MTPVPRRSHLIGEIIPSLKSLLTHFSFSKNALNKFPITIRYPNISTFDLRRVNDENNSDGWLTVTE